MKRLALLLVLAGCNTEPTTAECREMCAPNPVQSLMRQDALVPGQHGCVCHILPPEPKDSGIDAAAKKCYACHCPLGEKGCVCLD